MTTPASPTDGGPVAVLLAAGAGSRFGGRSAGHKLTADFRGRPVIAHAVDHAVAAGLAATWVVIGSVDLSSVLPDSVRVLENPDWEQGQATSLRRALVEARREGVGAVVVGLGDQPLIDPSAWRAVAAADGEIVVATYDGRRRNPVKLSSSIWDLLPETGDEGARLLMRNRPELVHEVPCHGDPADIDTREDLERWS